MSLVRRNGIIVWQDVVGNGCDTLVTDQGQGLGSHQNENNMYKEVGAKEIAQGQIRVAKSHVTDVHGC